MTTTGIIFREIIAVVSVPQKSGTIENSTRNSLGRRVY